MSGVVGQKSRAYRLVEPKRTLCRWCGLVWLGRGDVCPPHLMSEKEMRQWRDIHTGLCSIRPMVPIP